MADSYKDTTYKFFLQYKNHTLKGKEIVKPDWLTKFLEELSPIYDPNYVVTGSGAVVLYLNYFNELTNGKFNDLISSTRLPNDVDFLYYCKGTNYESRRTIGKFSRLQDSPQRSVTFTLNSSLDSDELPKIIKSFDLTCLSIMSYVTIDKYKVLSLEKLLNFYSNDLENSEMILSSNKSKMLDIQKSIEDSKKKRKLDIFLDLESEHETLEIITEKTKNELLAIESKINIINVLIKNINIEPAIISMYQIKQFPETKTTFHKQSASRNLFSSNIVKKLFDSSYDYDSTDNSGYESEQDLDEPQFKPKSLFTSFEDTPKKKPMIPIINSLPTVHLSTPTHLTTPESTRTSGNSKIPSHSAEPTTSTHLATPVDLDSNTPTIKYTYVPYKIKFDFEDDV